jgi:hypothetical protein
MNQKIKELLKNLNLELSEYYADYELTLDVNGDTIHNTHINKIGYDYITHHFGTLEKAKEEISKIDVCDDLKRIAMEVYSDASGAQPEVNFEFEDDLEQQNIEKCPLFIVEEHLFGLSNLGYAFAHIESLKG